MIDLVTPNSLKKSAKKKGKTLEIELSEEILKGDSSISKVISEPKRRKVEKKISPVLDSGSIVPDENFMLPNGLTFMKPDKVEDVDEITIPSDLDDPNNGKLLSDIISSRSKQAMPESGLKCVWSHKRKVRKKNRTSCNCYTELEKVTLSRLKSNKVLKSKRRFTDTYTDFERQAGEIQCNYPYCKRAEQLVSNTRDVVSKIISRSKKQRFCKKRTTALLKTGTKRPRAPDTHVKVKFSRYFINEVVRIMMYNTAVWSLDIFSKLSKTKQFSSRLVCDVILYLMSNNDFVSIHLVVSHCKAITEPHLVEIVTAILTNPGFSRNGAAPRASLREEQVKSVQSGLADTLSVTLSLPFQSQTLKKSIRKNIIPHLAKSLLEFIYENYLKTVSVYSGTLTLSQVIQWCDVIIEVYFPTLTKEEALIKNIHHALNQHIHTCRSLFGVNEFLFRLKHKSKFRQ